MPGQTDRQTDSCLINQLWRSIQWHCRGYEPTIIDFSSIIFCKHLMQNLKREPTLEHGWLDSKEGPS